MKDLDSSLNDKRSKDEEESERDVLAWNGAGGCHGDLHVLRQSELPKI